MNKLRDLVPADLPFGSLWDALESVHEVYSRAETGMDAFRSSSGLGCPAGCGTCCQGFIPDVTGLEATYLAAWLLRFEPAYARTLALEGFSKTERAGSGCPLYSDNPEAHCSVYAGRPLICRLFGFSATRSKDGAMSFALCRSMPPRLGSSLRAWKGADIVGEFAAMPPLMADLGSALAGIRPDETAERRLLIEALPDALRRVLFLSGFGAAERNDVPEPSPQTPVPVAG